MDRIAHETGGAAFDGTGKGLLEGFRQIDEQLRSSYELAYHTSNPPGTGPSTRSPSSPSGPG